MFTPLPPFENCPHCKAESAYGLSEVFGSYYQRRCKSCKKTGTFPLPKVDKKVIYLDQFALSNMMKAANNTFREGMPEPEKKFWADLYQIVRRLVLKQIAVFPDSTIHLHESLFSKFFDELRSLYESISGGLSFKDNFTIARFHLAAFAKAWLERKPAPIMAFDVEEILTRKKDVWLPIFRISTNMNFDDELIDGLRKSREETHAEFAKIFAQWKAQGVKNFKEYVEAESAAYGKGLIDGIHRLIAKMILVQQGKEQLTIDDVLNGDSITLSTLFSVMRAHGITDDKELYEKTIEFLGWSELKKLPINHIQSYLFAAIARKASSGGQNTPPNRGMMADIHMISTFMPYCDAMFIDNACAGMLSEAPLCDDLRYKTKIFCLNKKEEFLAYLAGLEANATPEIVKHAKMLYDVE